MITSSILHEMSKATQVLGLKDSDIQTEGCAPLRCTRWKHAGHFSQTRSGNNGVALEGAAELYCGNPSKWGYFIRGKQRGSGPREKQALLQVTDHQGCPPA